MQRIKKTYRLLSDPNLTMHMPCNEFVMRDIVFCKTSIYDQTGQFSTTDPKVQKWLESQYSFGKLFKLENEIDVTANVRPDDEEVPVFQNEETDVMEFPSFNAAKKFAIDEYGADPKDVRNIGLLEPYLKERGVNFKIG